MKNKRFGGITILGVLFVFSSLYYLIGNLNYGYYKFMFQQLPESAIKIRYFFTIFLRIVGIILGFGILLRKDMFRKLAIYICLFTAVTIYWKHPYYVFYNISAHIQCGTWDITSACKLTHPWHPFFIMIFYYLCDIIFSFACIFYFIRPDIKDKFNQ